MPESITRSTKMRDKTLNLPPILFGTSSLGNLYKALPEATKNDIVKAIWDRRNGTAVFDSAGKYGAGLALSQLGKGLRACGAEPASVLISNKLGWYQVELRGKEPSFEPGVWAGLSHDAEQRIGYEGILACYEQGKAILGEPYDTQLVSVHDPDEYLSAASSPTEREKRFRDVIDAYRALSELKSRGEVKAIGIGSKDWRVIRELADRVELDWVMLACSYTIYSQPPELVAFMSALETAGIYIINSAVFHSGFIIGGEYFDYRKPDAASPKDRSLFLWRERFLALCKTFAVDPVVACIQYGLYAPGVKSIALNTSRPGAVSENLAAIEIEIPIEFWERCFLDNLIRRNIEDRKS